MNKKFGKKKFLIVSYYGDSIDIAKKLVDLGHDVKFCVDDQEERETGEIGYGFVEHITTWRDFTDWADVIIFDNCGYGAEAEKLRSIGKNVIGGSIYTDKLEEDRDFGQTELKRFGIPILTSKNFTNFDEAIAYVKKNPSKYVMKPSGDKTVQHIGLLFVGEEEHGDDIIQLLTEYKKAWGHKIPAIQLQKKVTGVEMAVGAFFNGKEFVYPININFEHKKFFPGDIGPTTGEMGTSMFWEMSNKIFDSTLKKMESRLAQSGYVGYFDLNCIVDAKGVYPLEFTSRFGYPTFSIQQEGIVLELDEFLYGLVTKQFKKFETKKGFQIGVCIFVPPYPFNDPEIFRVKSRGSVIHFKKEMTKEDLKSVHILEVQKIKNEWVVSGTEGWPIIVSGNGVDLEAARSDVYRKVKNILIPNMYYRIDIGSKWYEESKNLYQWGYLKKLD
jgi:phosphoribosylamine--glycine ligase